MSAGVALTQGELDLRFHALSQPHRRSILQVVAAGEVSAGEIAAAFDVTRTAVSQHLTILRRADLVTERREGTRRYYRARAESLTQLHAALDTIWANALDRGKALAEETP